MKKTILFLSFLLTVTVVRTQNIDSFSTQPQTIVLSISTPQPRLKETFKITLEIDHLVANIFKSLEGEIQLSDNNSSTDNKPMTINAIALKKGKNEIGPLNFTLDKTKYTTNKIVYEVIDPLPNTNKGLWFRKINTSDSTFCIIIEQRIPANRKIIKEDENSISFTTEPEFDDIAGFKDANSIEGVSSPNSYSNKGFSSIEMNGEDKEFMYGFSVYNFIKVDKNAKIKITKDKFTNIPEDYKFENIIVK